jgi:exopolysaccharide biosynthesis protein
MRFDKRTVSICVAFIVIVGLAAAAWVLTDRSSAGDVEAAAASTTETVVATSQSESTQAVTAQSSSTQSTSAASSTTAAPVEGVDTGDTVYAATDTTYQSDSSSISITKVTTGDGSDTVTYFVADIQLTSATDLMAAFSGGEFESDVTQDTSEIAAANDAILAINGDYYGAVNDGVIIRNGVLYRNVPVRTGLALYSDGNMAVYDETEISAEQLLADGVWNTYSFGPGLLVDGDVPDDIDTYEAVSNPKHPIQGTNPRTGIGMISNNHFVFVVVDGRNPGYSRGVTLAEFAQIFKDLGCTTAYNLDGGGSSTMYFMGEVVNSPSQKHGERAVSDILYVK